MRERTLSLDANGFHKISISPVLQSIRCLNESVHAVCLCLSHRRDTRRIMSSWLWSNYREHM
uniref:Uncharacterized protein n=1 Tax=Rhizophora mucronata TaxID=61149 RepID=A0A2P2NJL1_RHIMU